MDSHPHSTTVPSYLFNAGTQQCATSIESHVSVSGCNFKVQGSTQRVTLSERGLLSVGGQCLTSYQEPQPGLLGLSSLLGAIRLLVGSHMLASADCSDLNPQMTRNRFDLIENSRYIRHKGVAGALDFSSPHILVYRQWTVRGCVRWRVAAASMQHTITAAAMESAAREGRQGRQC